MVQNMNSTATVLCQLVYTKRSEVNMVVYSYSVDLIKDNI